MFFWISKGKKMSVVPSIEEKNNLFHLFVKKGSKLGKSVTPTEGRQIVGEGDSLPLNPLCLWTTTSLEASPQSLPSSGFFATLLRAEKNQ